MICCESIPGLPVPPLDQVYAFYDPHRTVLEPLNSLYSSSTKATIFVQTNNCNIRVERLFWCVYMRAAKAVPIQSLAAVLGCTLIKLCIGDITYKPQFLSELSVRAVVV
jgi:hypothetical protein